ANTRAIDRTGGTMLHTSRTNPGRTRPDHLPEHLRDDAARYANADGSYDLTPVVVDNLARLGIDHLVVIGGDDTVGYAHVLAARGVPLVAIPKTMDNDVRDTEYCIGFSTAVTRAMEAVERQRTTVGSHERIGIFRIFGRDAGYTALYTAYATSIRCVIPEYKVDLDKLIQLLVDDKRRNPSNYSLAILSEGAEWEGYEVIEYG